MKKEIWLNNKKIYYELEYKTVKNINLRIKSDGSVYVSANRRVSQKYIEAFLESKREFILRGISRFEHEKNIPLKQHFSEEELREKIYELCKKNYPRFEKRGVEFPEIRFRRMVSQWGNCRSSKGILTFNLNLIYAEETCVEYVVLHEFTHFLVPNHSADFYKELEGFCPHWRECRKRLREIYLNKKEA